MKLVVLGATGRTRIEAHQGPLLAHKVRWIGLRDR